MKCNCFSNLIIKLYLICQGLLKEAKHREIDGQFEISIFIVFINILNISSESFLTLLYFLSI